MAIGLAKMVRTYQFVASLYLFCDVLPHICRLSLVFQQQEVDLSVVWSQVSATLALLSAYDIYTQPVYTVCRSEWLFKYLPLQLRLCNSQAVSRRST